MRMERSSTTDRLSMESNSWEQAGEQWQASGQWVSWLEECLRVLALDAVLRITLELQGEETLEKL